MRKTMINKAKLVINVRSNKHTRKIETVNVYDNRTGSFWNEERIKKRGILNFLDMHDMKETLNWNLAGDSEKFQFAWGMGNKEYQDGIAYVFN